MSEVKHTIHAYLKINKLAQYISAMPSHSKSNISFMHLVFGSFYFSALN